MPRWSGVALALRRPTDDRLQSRLSTYLHPVAGRTLVWHTMRAVSSAAHKPLQLLLVSGDAALSAGLDDLHAETVVPARRVGWAARVSERLSPAAERVLIVDASAAALDGTLRTLLRGDAPRALRDETGDVVAVWLERRRFVELAGGAPDLETLADACEDGVLGSDTFVVRDRLALARAAGQIRQRVIEAHMAAGVTFMLPGSVLVDVDVQIGADTLIYPGVVLEGHTTIGPETVIGPGSRIVDSKIGGGVELKGWNYVVNTTVRNRAVLEPYVRRGYD